jgi:hypothetical protein
MTTASRHAWTIWDGDLTHGTGTLNSASEALSELPVTYKTRVTLPDGQTSPEELIAAAHASCFSMALADLLAEKATLASILTSGQPLPSMTGPGRRQSPPQSWRSPGRSRESTTWLSVMPLNAPVLPARCLGRLPRWTSP